MWVVHEPHVRELWATLHELFVKGGRWQLEDRQGGWKAFMLGRTRVLLDMWDRGTEDRVVRAGSTRSWRRISLVKDEGFSKTGKKQIRRSKAIYPKPLAARFSVLFHILLFLLTLPTWRFSHHPLFFWKHLEPPLTILPYCRPLNKQVDE